MRKVPAKFFFLSRYFVQSGAHSLDSHHRDASRPPNPLDPFGRGGVICMTITPERVGAMADPSGFFFEGLRAAKGVVGVLGGGHLMPTP